MLTGERMPFIDHILDLRFGKQGRLGIGHQQNIRKSACGSGTGTGFQGLFMFPARGRRNVQTDRTSQYSHTTPDGDDPISLCINSRRDFGKIAINDKYINRLP